jgi:hypothetical protein
MDNVLYLHNRAEKRYLVVELDDSEHKRKGLVEDMFWVNWVYNDRFRGGKLYVLRVNPDSYRLADGEVVSVGLEERLARVWRCVRAVYDMPGDSGKDYVRVMYLYYTHDRVQAFAGKAGVVLEEVEKDVEYSVRFKPHPDPAYMSA